MGKIIENQKANIKMAEIITEYLRDSIETHQQEIEGMDGTIGFEEFSSKQASKIARIKELRRNGAEPNEIDEAIQQLHHYVYQYENYIGENGQETDLVSLKQEEIEELLSYIRESVGTFGLGDIPMSLGGNAIIKHILMELDSDLNGQDIEKKQRIEKWLTYLGSTNNVSLSQSPDKQYIFSYGYVGNTDELLNISLQSTLEKVCSVKTDGDVEYRNKPIITRNDIKGLVSDVRSSDLERIVEEAEKDSTKEEREGVSLDD